MPNYKIAPSLREHMVERAATLADKRVALAHADFPLTFDEVQALIVPEKQRATITKLMNEGCDSFMKAPAVKFILPKGAGVDRSTSIRVMHQNYNNQFLIFRQTQYAHYTSTQTHTDPEMSFSEHFVDTAILPPEKQQELAKWVNNAVRERRMGAITNDAVRWFLNYGVKGVEHITAAHVMARWPTLSMLVEGQTKRSQPLPDQDKYYKARFRDVPPKLDKWGWSTHDVTHGDYAKRKRMMQVADMVLTSATMMPEVTPDKDQLIAAVNNYEKFPGEKF